MSGYNREEVIGHTSIELDIFLNPGERDDFRQQTLERHLRGEEGIRNREAQVRLKSGGIHTVLISTEWIELDQGPCILASISDITERKQAEEKLQKAYDELELRIQERTEELRIAISELEDEIEERKRMEAELRQAAQELQAANEELTRFNRIMVGRELRMIELKKEVNELCGKVGESSRYPLDYEKEGA
jgi:PAS domain S-box-containing protein